jgi:hypothetical protein
VDDVLIRPFGQQFRRRVHRARVDHFASGTTRCHLRRQLCPDPFFIGKDEPIAAKVASGSHRLTGQQDGLFSEQCFLVRYGRCRRKAQFGKQIQPASTIEERVRRPYVSIHKTPPAVRQAKGEVDPANRVGHFQHEQQAAGGQQLLHMAQRLA